MYGLFWIGRCGGIVRIIRLTAFFTFFCFGYLFSYQEKGGKAESDQFEIKRNYGGYFYTVDDIEFCLCSCCERTVAELTFSSSNFLFEFRAYREADD